VLGDFDSTMTNEEQKKKNKEALLESYNLSKRMKKRLHIKHKGDSANIKKVKRVDW